MARGGKRTPRNPAPVSGPGSLSQRTDGGPGSQTQPIRVPTGGAYGEATALREAQQAAPLPDRQGAPAGTGTPTPDSLAQSPVPGGVFGPSDRPFESPTAGLVSGDQVPYDTDDAIRALMSVFPHPQLLYLLKGR